jgi:hypothetical protein
VPGGREGISDGIGNHVVDGPDEQRAGGFCLQVKCFRAFVEWNAKAVDVSGTGCFACPAF